MSHISFLYQDGYIIIIHKPAGLLMHRTPISRDTFFVLQTLRDQIGKRVYPIHRLDRAPSEVLVFGLTPEMARNVAMHFEDDLVEKEYLALVRGGR